MSNLIDGHDPLAYTRKVHIFVVKEAITNLEGIPNRKTKLPISVLKDLLARLEASDGTTTKPV